ncbi:MAG: TonB-dependent receptor [Dysgonamonadaceae bacterium]|nr:TonB-dependent receptor [Dysgonamonadaceae bacterium]
MRLLSKQKKCLRRICLILVIGLFPLTGLYAQSNRQISGVVSDITGDPLFGASVIEKGATNGTVTDINGKFTLTVKENATIEISFIGFKPQTLDVGQTSVFNIVLEEELNFLDEVIAIGYAMQKKKLNTGATVQVKGGDLVKMNTLSPLQALQGQMPGVQMAATSGQPGSAMKVVVRGLGTVHSFEPLYIIDGIEGDISVLNAADIQQIDVLKDAASAAIYGAQGANGVVLITTKQGTKGKSKVSFDAYYGVQKAARKAQMLNAEEYKIIMNEQALNSGSAFSDFDAMEGLADTDWMNLMLKDDAKTENYSLNINGGSESSVYALSLNYTNQEGIVGGRDVSNYERYGFRINTEHKLYGDALKVGQHLNFNYIRNTGISVGNQYNNTLRGAFATSPLSPAYSDNNLYESPFNDTSNSPWYNGDGNPYGLMMTSTNNANDNQKLLADVYAEWQPLKNLKLKTIFGMDYYAGEYRSYTPLYRFSIYSYNEDHTTVNQNMSKGHTMTWTNTASYDFNLNETHAFSALLGMEAVRYQGTYVGASNWNLLAQFDDFAHAYLDNTTGQAHFSDDGTSIIETRYVNGSPENKYRRVSYFGRIGYNYREKYLFNTTVRIDSSSKFAQGHRAGAFPSFSAGWVMTSEDFMEATQSFLDYLKIRASWGQIGNQNIDDFQYTSPINTSTAYDAENAAAFYVFGTNKINVPGAYPNRLSNPNVKWETSEQTDIGFDARFFKRLDVNLDFYIKTTKDWLVVAPILATGGANPPVINGGNVKNTGIEMAFNWNDRIGQVNYHVGVNGAYNKNVVGEIPTDDGIIHGLINMLYDNSEEFYRAQDGHAIGYFWGYKTAGIFQSQADIDAWKADGNGILQPDVKPGDVKYVDIKKDGIINADDKTDLGNGIPDFTYGFNIGLDYKGFDFSVNAYGAVGNKIVQAYRNQTNKRSNYTTAVLGRWTGEGTSNRIPRVTDTNINWQFSDLYLQDGDYLKISNITLGYDFAKLINCKYLSQVRLYGQIQNAFTFTKYDGMDPEIGYGTDGWVSGVDLGYYPRPQTFLFGVNLKF